MKILIYKKVVVYDDILANVSCKPCQFDIAIHLHLSFKFAKYGIGFTVKVPDKTFGSGLNIFPALLRALESQTVAALKYDSLKYKIREKHLWSQL